MKNVQFSRQSYGSIFFKKNKNKNQCTSVQFVRLLVFIFTLCIFSSKIPKRRILSHLKHGLLQPLSYPVSGVDVPGHLGQFIGPGRRLSLRTAPLELLLLLRRRAGGRWLQLCSGSRFTTTGRCVPLCSGSARMKPEEDRYIGSPRLTVGLHPCCVQGQRRNVDIQPCIVQGHMKNG